MREHPILFSGPMVRAILEGRKTQTRRVCKVPSITPGNADTMRSIIASCPYGQLGDLLWVRETHYRFTGLPINGKPWDGMIVAPDGNPYNARCYDDYQLLGPLNSAAACVKVPSIHMPRWASRLTLRIMDILIQRVQEITQEDAKAEGAEYQYKFMKLWDSINAKRGYSWESNPWVWAISFERVPTA